ncbi:MAG: Trk system potassium transporter TrkA [Clostridia bacterium]|nr:Trk system potassium transporter TrkA [Clostridia bacterium]
MNIVIVGGGKVGYALADVLARENHDVTMIDNDQEALDRACNTLDIMGVFGNGANVKTLIEAGVDHADMLICVTAEDEINMVCSLMAKKLGAKYVISRIRDPEYTESLNILQSEMGIDMAINPERGAAFEISRLLRYPFAGSIETFAHGRVEMVEFRVEQSDRIAGVPIMSLPLKQPKVLYCAVERDGAVIIPDGKFVMRVGDRVHVAGEISDVTNYFKKLGRNTHHAKSALLIGGGDISYYLARIMTNMDMHVIELKSDRCKYLSEEFPNLTVINGDGTDQELLMQENISQLDALVCITDRDEENLLTGLFGVKCGVGKVIVKINRLNYLELVSNMGIDSVISPKYSTASAILRQVRARAHSRGSSIEKIHRIVSAQAEVLEFTATEGASYIGVPLSKLHINKGILVGVIVRNEKVIIPSGSDHIEPGDTVMLVAMARGIADLEDELHT